MTPEELFTAALGLGRQWQVAECRFEGEPKRLELRLQHVPGEHFECPICQKLKIPSSQPSFGGAQTSRGCRFTGSFSGLESQSRKLLRRSASAGTSRHGSRSPDPPDCPIVIQSYFPRSSGSLESLPPYNAEIQAKRTANLQHDIEPPLRPTLKEAAPEQDALRPAPPRRILEPGDAARVAELRRKPWNGIDPNGPIAIAVTPSGCEISGNPIWT